MQSDNNSNTAAAAVSGQASMRQFFTSNRSSGGSSSSSSSSTRSTSSLPPVVHSSLPFAASPSPVASICSSASASPSSSQSSATKRRRQQRDEEEDAIMREVTNANSSSSMATPPSTSAPSILTPCMVKLPARSLLYQLHVLRSDETMSVRGLDASGSGGSGGGGVAMKVQSIAEQEAEMEAREVEEEKRTKAAVDDAATHVFDPSCMYDGEEKGDSFSSSSSSASCFIASASSTTELDDAALAISASSPPPIVPCHPLFPESLDFVSLFLGAASAHQRFQQLQSLWKSKGVRNIRARVIEFQLTDPIQLLMINSEAQQRAWMAATAASASVLTDHMEEDGAVMPVQQPTMRASPFSKPQRTSGGSSSSIASSAVPAVAVPPPAAAAPSSSLPSLYIAPVVSDPLRSFLDAREDTLAGFCVSSTLSAAAAAASSSSSSSSVSSLHSSSVVDGELILRASICASHLHIVDDDKKGRWNQQLLTDLFGRMDMTTSNKQHGGRKNSSSSSSSSSSNYSCLPTSQQLQAHPTFSSSSSLGPQPPLQLAPSSFAAHILSHASTPSPSHVVHQ